MIEPLYFWDGTPADVELLPMLDAEAASHLYEFLLHFVWGLKQLSGKSWGTAFWSLEEATRLFFYDS